MGITWVLLHDQSSSKHSLLFGKKQMLECNNIHLLLKPVSNKGFFEEKMKILAEAVFFPLFCGIENSITETHKAPSKSHDVSK